MPPVELWGPATWTLFHTLAENIDETKYQDVRQSLFEQIQALCAVLPCPDCANHATHYLTRIPPKYYESKDQLRHLLWVFHNDVNRRKKKLPFDKTALETRYKLTSSHDFYQIMHTFFHYFQTRGNMKLLTESFQRTMALSQFKNWFLRHRHVFLI